METPIHDRVAEQHANWTSPSDVGKRSCMGTQRSAGGFNVVDCGDPTVLEGVTAGGAGASVAIEGRRTCVKAPTAKQWVVILKRVRSGVRTMEGRFATIVPSSSASARTATRCRASHTSLS